MFNKTCHTCAKSELQNMQSKQKNRENSTKAHYQIHSLYIKHCDTLHCLKIMNACFSCEIRYTFVYK